MEQPKQLSFLPKQEKLAVIGRIFKSLKLAKKYAKNVGGKRIIFTTSENNYLVI